VLDRELYPDWRPTTFYAQAIAARSYAIHNLLHASADRHYDVESTQASQAYGGTTANLRAAQAVLETTGLVLTDGRGVLKAFYSSTCGGAGASPTDAFGIATDQRPLRPVARRAWCRDSKHFTWGPIRRGRADLSVRIAAWGKRRGLEIAKLGMIRSVAIAEFNHVGRPSRFALTDASGRRFELVAESFRQACNHTASGLPARGERLKSAFVEVERRGEQIVFTDGRGFGHGVGLCQFGAEAMANAGRDVVQVLQTYYPGAQIERVY
jgi:stage II sporulation protein D